MSTRELGILAVLASVMLALAIGAYSIRQADRGHEYVGTPWMETFDINAVTGIDIEGPGKVMQVSLVRRPEGWGVAQREYYPAKVGSIRSLLLDLSGAKLLERKTDDPTQHAQLGLGRIDRTEARGQQITLHFAQGSRTVRLGTQPSGRTATFVRSGNDTQAWLVDRTFNIPSEARRWLETDLLDIDMEQVHHMRISHPDGEVIEGKVSASDAARFEVLNVPAGRTLTGEFVLNRVASAITSLSLEDVMPIAQAQAYLAQTPQIAYDLYDGYILEAQMFQLEHERYARFSVRLKDSIDSTHRAEAEQLARRLQPWAFRIPSFAYDSMALRWSDILEEEMAEPAAN